MLLLLLLSVCVCVGLSLSLSVCLLVMVGGFYLLFFLVTPVQCGAPGPTSDYPAFPGSQRLGALFTGSVEIPVVVLLVCLWCVCVCVCARALEERGGSNACLLWSPRHDKRLFGFIYGHVENPCCCFFVVVLGGG